MNQPPLFIETLALKAMGCYIQVHLDMTAIKSSHSEVQIEQQLIQLKQDIEHTLSHWEQIFSRFKDSSELMRLNRFTQCCEPESQWFTVSAELFEVLKLAVSFIDKTQGLVTPTLLQALCDLGYSQSFETLPTALMSGQSASVEHLQDATNIEFRVLVDGSHQLRLPSGMSLDLNGYVKGWAATKLAEQISWQHPWQMPCLVDMGGDIAVGVPKDNSGKSPNNQPNNWGVAIARPNALNTEDEKLSEYQSLGSDLAVVALDKGGIATSGQDYRRWKCHDQWRHHLIHPQTQQSAISDVLSATVIADSTLEAEVWAKYCLLVGASEAISWLNQNNLAGLIVDTSYQVVTSHKMTSTIIATL
ncbi:FAD:protein FMN transferase [Psychrobacter sanguinis]|uniref:FAD:protein FMN transferase n=1 Tax=Psychrobacter sanguinis TaxID=861445 RepID=UPI00020C9B69|nr:FAD:protein FMN transferase [Psychrobacter sanguinis]EGK11942.1 thiamine biosynthesis lipoprotein ApbE [Psychrobacter sp. 1501(2011)]MCD9151670.1 FAD:protein FMN transferase [Psychrobacter sanguinis]